MLWDLSASAGFTTGKPWLPLSENWREQAVSVEDADRRSFLSLYRELLALRRAHPALQVGDFRLLSSDDDLLVYERAAGDDRLAIVLNLAAEGRPLPERFQGRAALLSTAAGQAGAPEISGAAGLIFPA
jgi:glycosidase